MTPHSLAEAVQALAERPELRPIAGCTDLMVGGLGAAVRNTEVIDLLGVPELSGIEEGPDGLTIGATTTFTAIQRSGLVRQHFPALAAAAAAVGGWQIQNRATLGGNLANASPAGDSLPALLALDATVVCASAAGMREVPAASFFPAYRRTALGPGELIAAIRLPFPVPGAGSGAGWHQAFRKVGTREAQAISKVVVALAARIADGRIAGLRLAAGSVGPTPLRLSQTESAALGLPLDAATADLLGRTAAAEIAPIDDVRSTAAYRRFALERVVRRMVLELGENLSPRSS